MQNVKFDIDKDFVDSVYLKNLLISFLDLCEITHMLQSTILTISTVCNVHTASHLNQSSLAMSNLLAMVPYIDLNTITIQYDNSQEIHIDAQLYFGFFFFFAFVTGSVFPLKLYSELTCSENHNPENHSNNINGLLLRDHVVTSVCHNFEIFQRFC